MMSLFRSGWGPVTLSLRYWVKAMTQIRVLTSPLGTRGPRSLSNEAWRRTDVEQAYENLAQANAAWVILTRFAKAPCSPCCVCTWAVNGFVCQTLGIRVDIPCGYLSAVAIRQGRSAQ